MTENAVVAKVDINRVYVNELSPTELSKEGMNLAIKPANGLVIQREKRNDMVKFHFVVEWRITSKHFHNMKEQANKIRIFSLLNFCLRSNGQHMFGSSMPIRVHDQD